MKIEIKEYEGGYLKEGADVKLRYSLIPPEVLQELAKILTHGAAKYAPNNWKKCEDTSFYWDSLFRHLQSHRLGEVVDKDSGEKHLSHALCSLMFLVWFNEKDNNGSKEVQVRAKATKRDN